jgi:formate hydrogenlyase transcriptional activator
MLGDVDKPGEARRGDAPDSVVSEDITERKRAGETLHGTEERWRTADRYRTLLEINNAIITNLTQDALLHAISETLRRAIPLDQAAFTLYDPTRETFRYLAIEGALPSGYFRVGLEVGRQESICAWVFDHQRPVVRCDLEKEQHYPNDRRLLDEGINSYCVAPLIVGGKGIGTLNIASQNRNQYSDSDAEFLREVANQVALAVANMRSYEEIGALNLKVERTAERYRTLLEINNAIITHLTQEALLHSVSETLHRIIPFDRAAFTLYNPTRATFRYLAIEGTLPSEYFRAGVEFPRAESMAAWVFDQQRPALRRDLEKEQQYPNDRRLVAEGIKADCLVPLIVGGKSIGTLNIGSKTRNQYSEADMEFLQEAGNQVALAVENMQSYEEIAALKAKLEKENVYLQEEIRTEHNFEEIVGNSPALLAVLRKVEQVASTDSTVLICGETGTGKELIARAIHGRSPRRNRPLVKVNCSAISAGLVESELFGHMKGAFTGAIERRIGRFELADGGTIFLDEVGELPLETQVKLLRVLQEHEFEPVGSSRSLRVDVRVIAATNRNLEEFVQAGGFRSDLFYRLNVFPLEVPSLRERRSDIPQLAMVFLSHYAKNLCRDMAGISQDAMDRLARYSWPGNVRELQNVIERAVILSRGSILELEPDLVPMLTVGEPSRTPGPPSEMVQVAKPTPPRFATLEEVERDHILTALKQTNGVVEGPKGAARMLNLHPNTLRHRMDKLGIKRSASHIS